MENIIVSVSQNERKPYLESLYALDGLRDIVEDKDAAYCPISLTCTPENLKPMLLKRQKQLMHEVLEPVGIRAYDPASAPYSPDLASSFGPEDIYRVDSAKIASARYFVGHNILPSTGFGIESEKAKFFNRMAVILMDAKIRISRMQPHRAIYLQYNVFDDAIEDLKAVFTVLHQYDLGMGFQHKKPVLLGFPKQGGEVVNLETLIYQKFPHLRYMYNPSVPIA